MDELDDEHATIAAAARVFAEEQIAPYSREWDRAETMDRSVVGKLADVGFLGAPIPEAYGGAGMDALGYCLVVEELGRVDSSVRGVVTVNTGLVAKSVLAWGTEEQRRRWLPGLCRGEPLGCFALTEPDHGSDAGNLTTHAVRDDDHWVVSGSKVFITNGTWAGLALVFARTGEPGPAGISAFLVPTDTDGFTAHPIKGKLGLRAQDTAEITLTDVHVPDDHRLGEIGNGFRIAMSALDAGRMSMGAACVGIAQACLDAATSYASQRHTFGRPIAERQLVQELIADIAVEVVAARLLTWRAAAAADAGKRHTVEASMAKYFASEAAVRAANSAMQVFGGYGYVDEFPVGRFLRDARVTTLYEGTSQLQKLIIGRHLTGHDALT